MLKFLYLCLLIASVTCDDSDSSSSSSSSSSSEEDLDLFDRDEDEESIKSPIYGGNYVPVATAKYIAQLLLDDWAICGGTIVSETVVITAAHCIQRPINIKGYRVITGSTFRGHGGTSTKVKRIIPHEKYDKLSSNNDIAIIELETPIKFGLKQGPLKLSSEKPGLGDKLTIVGFGKEGAKKDVSILLKSAVIEVADRSSCEKSYLKIHPPSKLTKNQFCAGNGYPDTCQGDSGGPVVLQKNNALVGVVSFGLLCETTNIPGVYTEAVNYRSWIEETVGLKL